MKNRSCICFLLVSSLIMPGCTSTGASAPPPALLPRSNIIYGTQVSTGPCVAGAEAAGLLATLAGAVISRGVSRIGAGLQEAARSDTQTALARRNVEMTAEGLGRCIVVMRGWFYRSRPDQVPGDFPFREGSAFPITTTAGVNQLWGMGLFVAATPDFYFQGRLVRNSAENAYTVVPIHATLDRPLLSNSLRSDRRSVTIAFAVASGGASGIQGGGSTVVLGQIRPGVLATFPRGSCVVTTQVGEADPSLPAIQACPEDPVSNAVRIIRTPFESEWFTPSLTAELKPMTLLAQVSETRDEAKFLSFVSALFSDVQAAGTTALQRALVPELGADAAETETTQQEANSTAYDNALVAALTSLDACIAAPADVAKRTAARVALRAYVAAARRAEVATSLGDDDVLSITPQGTNPAACQAARDALAG